MSISNRFLTLPSPETTRPLFIFVIGPHSSGKTALSTYITKIENADLVTPIYTSTPDASGGSLEEVKLASLMRGILPEFPCGKICVVDGFPREGEEWEVFAQQSGIFELRKKTKGAGGNAEEEEEFRSRDEEKQIAVSRILLVRLQCEKGTAFLRWQKTQDDQIMAQNERHVKQQEFEAAETRISELLETMKGTSMVEVMALKNNGSGAVEEEMNNLLKRIKGTETWKRCVEGKEVKDEREDELVYLHTSKSPPTIVVLDE